MTKLSIANESGGAARRAVQQRAQVGPVGPRCAARRAAPAGVRPRRQPVGRDPGLGPGADRDPRALSRMPDEELARPHRGREGRARARGW